MTVALLFLMTRLILPGEQDRIVTRMIRNIEFQRTVRLPDPVAIQVFERPRPVKERPAPTARKLTAEDSTGTQKQDLPSAESAAKESPAHVIDWWTEARRLTRESDEEAFKRWLLEQGYERYVSIMQGPLPITNSVQGTLPDSQEDVTGYRNIYGDMEIKISKNCVMQTQVSARLDISDFTRNLPMRVVCKGAPKATLSLDRNDRQ